MPAKAAGMEKMLDEVRKPGVAPTREESGWMEASAVGMVVRAVALAGVALVIGAAASLVVDRADVAHGFVATVR